MTPERQLAGFIAKFTAAVAALIRAARKKMRARLPGASELVYDNYNFMVIGYGTTEKASELVFSLAAYAKGLNLFFAEGAKLPDPGGILLGGGKRVRSIRVERAADLDRPEVKAVMKAAVAHAGAPIDRHGKRRLIIKAVSPKQRPRR